MVDGSWLPCAGLAFLYPAPGTEPAPCHALNRAHSTLISRLPAALWRRAVCVSAARCLRGPAARAVIAALTRLRQNSGARRLRGVAYARRATPERMQQPARRGSCLAGSVPDEAVRMARRRSASGASLHRAHVDAAAQQSQLQPSVLCSRRRDPLPSRQSRPGASAESLGRVGAQTMPPRSAPRDPLGLAIHQDAAAARRADRAAALTAALGIECSRASSARAPSIWSRRELACVRDARSSHAHTRRFSTPCPPREAGYLTTSLREGTTTRLGLNGNIAKNSALNTSALSIPCKRRSQTAPGHGCHAAWQHTRAAPRPPLSPPPSLRAARPAAAIASV